MNRNYRKLATDADRELPRFETSSEALDFWLGFRDDYIALLEQLSSRAGIASLTFASDEWKQVDALLMQEYERGQASRSALMVADLEVCAGVYAEAVAVTTYGARWIARESPLAPEHYDLAVTKGLMTLAAWRIANYFRLPVKERKRNIHDLPKYFAMVQDP